MSHFRQVLSLPDTDTLRPGPAGQEDQGGAHRLEGGDLDQHVSELLREWMEVSPEKATLGGLVRLLRDQNFIDTALRLETGTYTKKR